MTLLDPSSVRKGCHSCNIITGSNNNVLVTLIS